MTDLDPALQASADERVRARVAAAAERREQAEAVRRTLARRRAWGLRQRHAARQARVESEQEETDAYDPVATGWALTAAAIRGDDHGVGLLLDGLGPAQLREATRAAVFLLADGLRLAAPADRLDSILGAVQALARTRATT